LSRQGNRDVEIARGRRLLDERPDKAFAKEKAMKYLVLCYYDVKEFEALPKDRLDAMVAECKIHDVAFKATGKVDFVASQSDPKTWKCIRGPKGRKPEVTAGPYAESREQVGAFFIVEAKDMDEALAVAMKHPGPNITQYLGGGLEIRACDFYEEPNKAKA
jgi:hypothetical protein